MGRSHQGSRTTRSLDLRVLRFQNQANVEEPAMLTRDLLVAGRLDDARAVFEHALERDPHDDDLLLTGGELFLERGDVVWAKRLLIVAAQRNPGWASPWLALARTLLATRDLDRAEAVLDRCWELAPDAPETWALDERLSGESILERRMQSFLRDPEMDDPAMLANALLAAEREDDALAVLDRGLEVFPEDVDALFVRARLHEVRGELDAARSDLARATGSDQSWATAWEALEDVCRRTGDHVGARRAESSARNVRERAVKLEDLDRAFLVGAADILTHDLATLCEDSPAGGFAPVPELSVEAFRVEEELPFESAVASGVPVEDDLFPTYHQVHETLPPPAACDASETMSDALDITVEPVEESAPLEEPAVDTLVGHPAPGRSTRGLRLSTSGRQPYVPPSPGELRPQADDAGEPSVVTVVARRPGRSWAR